MTLNSIDKTEQNLKEEILKKNGIKVLKGKDINEVFAHFNQLIQWEHYEKDDEMFNSKNHESFQNGLLTFFKALGTNDIITRGLQFDYIWSEEEIIQTIDHRKKLLYFSDKIIGNALASDFLKAARKYLMVPQEAKADFKKNFQEIYKIVDSSVVAQEAVALCYLLGIGIEQNFENAELWFEEVGKSYQKNGMENISISHRLKKSFSICVFFVDKSKNHYLSSSLEGINWTSANQIMTGWLSSHHLSPIKFKGKLYVAAVGLDDKIYFFSLTDENKFNNVYKPFDGWMTNRSVHLAIFKGKLYISMIGYDKHTYLSYSSNGTNWCAPYRTHNDWEMTQSSCMARFKGKLYITFVNKDKHFFISSSSDGMHWEEPINFIKDWETGEHLQIINFKEKLYICCLGIGKRISLFSSLDGINWSKPYRAFTWLSPCPASLVNYQGKLYMSLVCSSNKVYLTSSLDGKNWRAPYLLSESWRSFKSVSLVVTNDELDTM
nr:9541_t:CDS:1 [Entrophospora candida]